MARNSPFSKKSFRKHRDPRILVMIIAGGKGERLMPLTAQRTKPAIPFGGNFRIIDFVLSNFLNSNLMSIYVLVQYKSQSLIEHLRRGWRIGGRIQGNFITIVPPQMRKRSSWYEGTADAVYQNINLFRDFAPDLIAIFGADHIYRMDMNQMVHYHLVHKADATVAAIPVPVEQAKGFGIIQTNAANRITGFEEKPKQPKPLMKQPDWAYASMGNYLFNTETLIRALEKDSQSPGSHDFGKDIIPGIIGSHRVFAYNFFDNEIPGIQPYEEKGYWRDVGTLDAYWEAHMDLLGDTPLFDLRNTDWPILTDYAGGPAASLDRSRLEQALIGQGSRVIDSEIRRSVIGRNVRIEPGTKIEDSIILDGSVIESKATLRRTIVDRFNIIPKGVTLDAANQPEWKDFTVTKSGLLVLPRGLSIGGRAVIQ